VEREAKITDLGWKGVQKRFFINTDGGRHLFSRPYFIPFASKMQEPSKKFKKEM